MELGKVLLVKYPQLKPNADYVVIDNGSGAFIKEWKANSPKPTDSELQTMYADMQTNPPVEPLSELDQVKKQQELMQKALDDLIFSGGGF